MMLLKLALNKINIQTISLLETMKRIIIASKDSANVISSIDKLFSTFGNKFIEDPEIKEISHIYWKHLSQQLFKAAIEAKSNSNPHYLKVMNTISTSTKIELSEIDDYCKKQEDKLNTSYSFNVNVL